MATVLLLMGGVSLDAEEGKKRSKGGHHGHMLRMLDEDKDGMVSKVEMLTHFDKIDGNGDGLLSEEEFKAQREKMKEKHQEMKKQCEGMKPGERLAKMDTNGDGSISQDEFKGPDMMFQKLDANSDGTVSPDEMEAMKGKMKKHREKRGQRGEKAQKGAEAEVL
jgi:Ca2+-binding EF-hand superfamily protein